MSIITKIVAQKRRAHRYSIFIDGIYRTSLSEEQLTDGGWREGDELTPDEIEQLVASSDFGKALDRAANYISYRPRSAFEVESYLKRQGYDGELIGQLVAELERRDLINDERFGRLWVEERQLLQPRSRRRLKQELQQKRLSAVAIETALAEVGEETEVETARQLIIAKRLRQRYDQPKLLRYLTSLGFSWSTAKTAVDTTADPNELNEEAS